MQRQDEDDWPTEVLKRYGARVVRVSADAVMNRLDEVVQVLRDLISGKTFEERFD